MLISEQNVAIIRLAYLNFQATGRFEAQVATPDFVWDMSNYAGWTERQVYEGAEGAQSFFAEWTAAWEHWEVEVEELRDAGDRVVAVLRQRGRSKVSGIPLDQSLAQVWTLRDGMLARADMYSDPAEALRAADLGS
jgi:ketosteroid isomerase-like protein